MNDPYFDHKSAKRFDRQRASGPFGTDEVLPTKISAWISRKHPETSKKQTLLNFVDWQKGQAERILSGFELHVYEWSLKAVKLRESLDKQDKRDVAQAVFAQDRDGRLVERIDELRGLTFDRDEDGELEAEQNQANLELARSNLMDEWLLDEANDFSVKDRPVVAMGVSMTLTEYDILRILLRVFDHARSHFVFEICEESVRRLLNATRIRYEEGGDRMPWASYRTTILARMKNSSVIDGLISYVLKPRENGCAIGLWVAERIAERRLLNDDGIEMSEDTWLELVLAFMTNEEKQTLQVPARERRQEYDEDRGYTVLSLQEALAPFDPATFRKFKQAFCLDPVALRVVSIANLTATKVPAPRAPGNFRRSDTTSPSVMSAELESHAATRDKPVMAKFDLKSSLPGRNGKPDEEVYAKFKANGLRRRIWDSIAAGKCARCNGDHLRIACPKPRASWEDDFERDNFFLPKAGDSSATPKKGPRKKNVRVQLISDRNVADERVLFVESPLGRCLLDTCSDVTIARMDVMQDLRLVPPIVIGHMGGETSLNREEVSCWGGMTSWRAGGWIACLVWSTMTSLPELWLCLEWEMFVALVSPSISSSPTRPGCHWTLAAREGPSASWLVRLSRWWSSFALLFSHPAGAHRSRRRESNGSLVWGKLLELWGTHL
jgi:hypothetical protein